MTLRALLAGGQSEQIPAEAFFALSHRMGNAALTETLLRLRAGPELVPYRSAERGIETQPFDWGGGPAEPPALEAPAPGAPGPLPSGLPAAAI